MSSFSPLAIRNCCSTKSMPAVSSVTGCCYVWLCGCVGERVAVDSVRGAPKTTNSAGVVAQAVASVSWSNPNDWWLVRLLGSMYGYAAASASASRLIPFAAPPKTTNSAGVVAQVAAVAAMPGLLQRLSSAASVTQSMRRPLRAVVVASGDSLGCRAICAAWRKSSRPRGFRLLPHDEGRTPGAVCTNSPTTVGPTCSSTPRTSCTRSAAQRSRHVRHPRGAGRHHEPSLGDVLRL